MDSIAMLNRRLITIATLGLVSAGALGLALAQPKAATTSTPPLTVRAVTLGASADAGDGDRYAATIHFDREATLAFRVPGRIAALPVRVGDRLAPGALVASLESPQYAAAVTMRSADAARASRDAERLTGLVDAGAVSPAAAATARDGARSADAALAAARYDLASTRLTAPFAALVLSRSAETGEAVGAGQQVVRVADRNAALLAVADVPAAVAQHLHAGTSAQVWPEGAAAPLIGQVRHIAGGADPHSGLVAVEIALPASTHLASGSAAAVHLDPGAAPAADMPLHLPAEALIDADGTRASVWQIDGQGRAHRVQVHFYGFDDRDALIGGLPSGTRVITAGAGFVGEGQRVEVSGS
jgi:RND family efflux transporter MFP subunit